MAASAAEIEDFLAGPLVTWLSTCIKKPETLHVYETFFDGGPINEVLLQIDPEPSLPVPTLSNLQGSGIIASRTKIFHCIIRNIKVIYEAELGQVVIALPDCVNIGRAPASKQSLEHLKLLILLLLGCAVQGPTKEIFITRIKELAVEAQHDIVECIKQVTVDQTYVLTEDWPEQSALRLFMHLRSLTKERDVLFQHWVTDIGQEIQTNGGSLPNTSAEGFESNHLAVELADWKARLRKQRQELEEKTELLTECKEELEHASSLVSKLKTENADLLAEARKAKSYRDEVDAMRERAERVDKLEAEAQRYRERLADTDFYRVRVTELREDNRVLLETREMLEAQLARARQRADHVLELEAELIACKQTINDITLERDSDRERMQELIEENFQLQQVTKSALQESCTFNTTINDSDNEESNSGDNSLSEQLTNNAQARALKLELENRKLLTTIDSLKEHNFHESSKKILDLEKERKKLELKYEQMQEHFERLKLQNRELEELFKDSIQENRKLQDTIDTSKVISDRQIQDLQNERMKIEDLEKNIDGVTKEKQRIQALCDTVRKRADDAEKSLTQINEQLQNVQGVANKSREHEKLGEELKDKITLLEKENCSIQKDVAKLKELIESKDRSLDEHTEKSEKQEKEIIRLSKECETTNIQIEKLQEFEQKSQELISQTAIYTETISTLQKDLISEKVCNEKFKTSLEKLGLNLDILDNDINIIVEKMMSNPDIAKNITSLVKDRLNDEDKKCLKCQNNTNNIESDILAQTEQVVSTISAEFQQQSEKLCMDINNLQGVNESLQNENARMQVDISTLSSQVNSLQTQQTALQLANSQLVAEKEDLVKQNDLQNIQHDTLLLDQVTIRTLHEQLNAEYEELKMEQEGLKRLNRDMRIEVRTLKEANLSLEKKTSLLETEKDVLKNDTKNLTNLRMEHSKLKEDFRNLFTANERLKSEYRGLQDEYKNLRAESRVLRLGNTEMQGELNTRTDLVSGLRLDNAKLQQRCDMLFEMNQNLDVDRRALMEHVSKLLSQYHSLLMHSLDDKKHYHSEEKLFADKLNNLCRQKEKLEEKIMEHYRKLDNASAKKKGFGATLVRRVRKAGSDVINKIPTSRNRRSWHEDTQRLTQSQFTLGGGSGESGNNDSDENSVDETQRERSEPRAVGSLHGQKPRDEVALRRSQRDLTHRNSVAGIEISSPRNSVAGDQVYARDAAPLSLGSVGTRRTVYLSEDDPPPTPAANNNQSTNTTTGTNNQSTAPTIVYNRISTVIGGEIQRPPAAATPQAAATNPAEETPDGNAERKKGDNAKENAIWYEYGCV